MEKGEIHRGGVGRTQTGVAGTVHVRQSRREGFAGMSLCKALRLLGVTGASEAAEKASHWLWIMRDKLLTVSRITGVRAYEVERPENPNDLWYYH